MLPTLALFAQGTGLATGIPQIDAVANLSIAIALIVAIGKGWLVPGAVHTAERERTTRLDTALDAATQQNGKLLEITEDVLKLVERAEARELAKLSALASPTQEKR